MVITFFRGKLVLVCKITRKSEINFIGGDLFAVDVGSVLTIEAGECKTYTRSRNSPKIKRIFILCLNELIGFTLPLARLSTIFLSITLIHLRFSDKPISFLSSDNQQPENQRQAKTKLLTKLYSSATIYRFIFSY